MTSATHGAFPYTLPATAHSSNCSLYAFDTVARGNEARRDTGMVWRDRRNECTSAAFLRWILHADRCHLFGAGVDAAKAGDVFQFGNVQDMESVASLLWRLRLTYRTYFGADSDEAVRVHAARLDTTVVQRRKSWRMRLVAGWFNDTLTSALATEARAAMYVNLNCDHAHLQPCSTMDAYEWLFAHKLIRPGTLVSYAHWHRQALAAGDVKAHIDITHAYGVEWEYVPLLGSEVRTTADSRRCHLFFFRVVSIGVRAHDGITPQLLARGCELGQPPCREGNVLALRQAISMSRTLTKMRKMASSIAARFVRFSDASTRTGVAQAWALYQNEPCDDGPPRARHWVGGSQGSNAPNEAACRARCAVDSRCNAYVYGYGLDLDSMCRQFTQCSVRYAETAAATGIKVKVAAAAAASAG